jgi:hypothetical protein
VDRSDQLNFTESLHKLSQTAVDLSTINALKTIIEIARPLDGLPDPIEIRLALDLVKQMESTRELLLPRQPLTACAWRATR